MGASLDGSVTTRQTAGMDFLGARLRAARERKGMSAAAASRALGYKASNVVTRWENGNNRPDPDDVVCLAELYEVDVRDLLGRDTKVADPRSRIAAKQGGHAPPEVRRIPIIGAVLAGIPVYAEENVIGETFSTHPRAEWALRVKGDSMIGAGIMEGDLAVCRSVDGPDGHAGEIVAALVAGESTLKYLVHDALGYRLKAANPAYQEIPCDGDCTVQGVVVEIVKRPPTVRQWEEQSAVIAAVEGEAPPPAIAPPPEGFGSAARPQSRTDRDRWQWLAEEMAAAIRLREENERLRIEKVLSVEAQARLNDSEARKQAEANMQATLDELRSPSPRSPGRRTRPKPG